MFASESGVRARGRDRRASYFEAAEGSARDVTSSLLTRRAHTRSPTGGRLRSETSWPIITKTTRGRSLSVASSSVVQSAFVVRPVFLPLYPLVVRRRARVSVRSKRCCVIS